MGTTRWVHVAVAFALSSGCGLFVGDVARESKDGGSDAGSPTDASLDDADAMEAGPSELCASDDGIAVDCSNTTEAPCPCPSNSHRVADGSCRADCGLSCPVHGWCDDSTGAPQCVCAPGYVLDGTNCNWVGVVKDPSCVGNPKDAWKLTPPATLEVSSVGLADPGWLSLPFECQSDAAVSQTLDMPEVADGEPYMLLLQTSGGLWPFPFFLELSLSGAPQVHPVDDSVFSCLGERAYGKNMELSLRAAQCEEPSTVRLDGFSIAPEAGCPRVGQVLNGDFETAGGWTGNAVITEGVGSNGSRGMVLTSTTTCSSASTLGALSTPISSIPRPALRVRVAGSPGAWLEAKLGTLFDPLPLESHALSGQPEVWSVCIPEWSKGRANYLTFQLGTVPALECDQPDFQSATLDDIEIVSDESCPAVANIVDGGFEHGGRGWTLHSENGSIQLRTQGSEAHCGSGSLQLTVDDPCRYISASTSITIPQASSSGGPAVTFHYRAQETSSSSDFVMSVYPSELVLAPASDYRRQTLCLDPRSAGRAAVLGFQARNNSPEMCGGDFEPETLDVDDVIIGTDPSCPSE